MPSRMYHDAVVVRLSSRLPRLPRLPLGRVLLLASGIVIPIVTTSACTRDYGSLFDPAASPIISEGGVPLGDARSDDDDAAGFGNDASTDGSVPPIEAGPGCDPICAGGQCSFTCNAACGCEGACPANNRCGFDCSNNAKCNVACGDNANGCDVTCRTGTSCKVDCQGGPCNLKCELGSSCSIECGSGSCEPECLGGGNQISCSGGVKGCNNCPP
jgi:hypothetical protein